MILMVDDEKCILNLYADFLKGQGYRVLACSSPIEALEVFQNHSSEIRTVISDYIMPGMNGLEFMDILQSRSPNIQKVLMTGYCFDAIPSDIYLLQKPFSIRSLLQVLSERDYPKTCMKMDSFESNLSSSFQNA